MVYCIAVKDKDGSFKIKELNGELKRYTKNEGIAEYSALVEWKGRDNVLLLETVSMKVKVSVTEE